MLHRPLLLPMHSDPCASCGASASSTRSCRSVGRHADMVRLATAAAAAAAAAAALRVRMRAIDARGCKGQLLLATEPAGHKVHHDGTPRDTAAANETSNRCSQLSAAGDPVAGGAHTNQRALAPPPTNDATLPPATRPRSGAAGVLSLCAPRGTARGRLIRARHWSRTPLLAVVRRPTGARGCARGGGRVRLLLSFAAADAAAAAAAAVAVVVVVVAIAARRFSPLSRSRLRRGRRRRVRGRACSSAGRPGGPGALRRAEQRLDTKTHTGPLNPLSPDSDPQHTPALSSMRPLAPRALTPRRAGGGGRNRGRGADEEARPLSRAPPPGAVLNAPERAKPRPFSRPPTGPRRARPGSPGGGRGRGQ
eukprot:scaffold156_cov308-Prasinococcus_capsulatus_cf.AAC.9